MGLDMYLSKRTYVQNWDHQTPEQRHTVTVTGPLARAIDSERVSYIVEEVAYWRKANAIHAWFVRRCQDGNDDCRDASVQDQDLRDLVDLCESLLAEYATDPEAATVRATTALPPQVGFFFGSSDIDQSYWDDLRDTVTKLRPCLGDQVSDYYYRSSW